MITAMTSVATPAPDHLVPGEFYWVTRVSLPRPDEWFIAKHDPSAAGSWRNDERWEDTDHAVVQWRRIQRPE